MTPLKEKQKSTFTVDLLRTYPGYESISDLEAIATLNALNAVAQSIVKDLQSKTHE